LRLREKPSSVITARLPDVRQPRAAPKSTPPESRCRAGRMPCNASSSGTSIVQTRKSRARRQKMMKYRLHLLGRAGHVRATGSFTADDDVRAIGIPQSVFSSCCDDFDGYAVWNGTTMIADDRRLRQSHWWAITKASQREVLDLEDRVQRTFASVSKSRQLRDAASKSRIVITRE
jgi:hypothetical protein